MGNRLKSPPAWTNGRQCMSTASDRIATNVSCIRCVRGCTSSALGLKSGGAWVDGGTANSTPSSGSIGHGNQLRSPVWPRTWDCSTGGWRRMRIHCGGSRGCSLMFLSVVLVGGFVVDVALALLFAVFVFFLFISCWRSLSLCLSVSMVGAGPRLVARLASCIFICFSKEKKKKRRDYKPSKKKTTKRRKNNHQKIR